MSTDLEQALRDAFRDAAETVVPRPEPMRRLLQRRRRRWGGLGALFAAVAVVASAALVPALQLGSPDRRDGDEGYRITSAWTRSLLQSPPRGSLTGDSPLQIEVEREIRARGGDNPRLDRVRLLFLGDAAGRRFVAYARYNDTHAALYYNDGDAGDSAARLVGGGVGNLPLTPLVRMGSATGPALLGLVPEGCRFATSTTATVEENGNVVRGWVAADPGDWVARESLQPAERWQVTCGGVLYSEGPAADVTQTAAGDDLVAAGGLTHGANVQRWSGPIDKTGRTWTLSTTLLSGGGVAAVLAGGTAAKSTVATDYPPDVPGRDGATANRDDWGLISTAVSADPDVVAIRVPERSGAITYLGERVLIVTSLPGAWTATVGVDIGQLNAPLDNGVAALNTIGGDVTVKDVNGKVIGRTYVPQPHQGPMYLGEKVISNW